MLNNIFTAFAVISIFVSSYIQYEQYVEQEEIYKRINDLEADVRAHKLEIQTLKDNQNRFENEVSDAWQKHDDEIYMIKVGLGLEK